jgi:hypothetical protein
VRDDTPGMLSIAHNAHPFVAFVHLLRNAQEGSTVHISIPYLTDVNALNELCHHQASLNLNIRAIVGRNKLVFESLNEFIGQSAQRQRAVEQLQLRAQDPNRPFAHTKGLISSAGCMIGSYNFTIAARKKNVEHGMVYDPGPICDELRAQLDSVWETALPMVSRRTGA